MCMCSKSDSVTTTKNKICAHIADKSTELCSNKHTNTRVCADTQSIKSTLKHIIIQASLCLHCWGLQICHPVITLTRYYKFSFSLLLKFTVVILGKLSDLYINTAVFFLCIQLFPPRDPSYRLKLLCVALYVCIHYQRWVNRRANLCSFSFVSLWIQR